jgi:putative Mg2+ transporter-C (MgtC) family protein
MPDLSDNLAEFLRDPQVEGLLRIVVAAIVTGVVGLEREFEGKPAGVRTYGLVGMGTAAFTVAGILGFGPGDPASRVVQGVATGIGFLGAGTILQMRHQIIGLTTAAGIWVAAALGVAIGAGLYIVGIGGAIAVLILLTFVRPEILARLGIVSRKKVEGTIEADE